MPNSVEEWASRAVDQLPSLSERDGLVWVRAGLDIAGADSGGEVSIVALSAWRDWDAVLTATGGHIDRLVQSTDLTDLERPIGVNHYELLRPDTRTHADEAARRDA